MLSLLLKIQDIEHYVFWRTPIKTKMEWFIYKIISDTATMQYSVLFYPRFHFIANTPSVILHNNCIDHYIEQLQAVNFIYL